MKKDRLMIVILMVFVFLNCVVAEKIDIQIKNSYIPGDDLKLKVVLYDDNNNVIQGQMNFKLENYYSEVMKEGIINSYDIVEYVIPEDAIQGPWRISVKYNDLESNRLFNVGELEKADIKIENDQLIITNIGNVIYEKPILIYIGDTDQTVNVKLEVGESKTLKLTAPLGTYTVKINDGTSDKDLVFDQVSLTGNVVGIERPGSKNFWKNYPMVSVFLVALIIVFIFVSMSRISLRKKEISKLKKRNTK